MSQPCVPHFAFAWAVCDGAGHANVLQSTKYSRTRFNRTARELVPRQPHHHLLMLDNPLTAQVDTYREIEIDIYSHT